MRKLAPAFVMTTIVALASGSAFALGDMHKDKKAPKDTTTSSTSSTMPGTSANTPAPAASASVPSSSDSNLSLIHI